MSLPPTKGGRSSTNQEFTAIILAGLGGNLIPFSNPENLPKALLPIANKALISYPLAWVEKAGITSTIILCLDAHEAAINSWLKTTWKGTSRPFLLAASSEDEVVGSADAIRTLLSDKHKDKVRSDVIILSCDTICEIPPHELLDTHRLSNASITAVFYRNHPADVLSPVKKGSKTFTAFEKSSSTLLYTNSEADIEDDLELRTSMLWKFPKVDLTTSLTDLHLYVCRRAVLDLVRDEDAIARINTDLLPLLCKAQFQSLLRSRHGLPDSTCAKVYVPRTDHFCARVNTKQAFVDMNRHVLKSLPSDARHPPSTTVGDRTTVGPDSALGPDSTVDEKTTIKRTLIGSGVSIGKLCRLTNCIVMDGVVVRDQVKLENCVLCVGAVVHDKASLKDCIVGGNVNVPEKTERKGEEMVVGGEISMGV
ncbi:Translation initiation factor eIF-2B subunit gamma [Taphrina deformans PYCC 5710]|uniref:Translation initiation factor eIF2B subunit gamma n=1 Tax=Taphrina deformans (strain PYCC 5710 / ATCC 11124 / CBS 356.35 / IMI 108563 / JCM 9778 / NBRC 8474) TaxID=1097556 RepID=R4XB60_TAPDE|nr:Translation initiation factor eIF-2B subunit gamma [Taphrina deformans PYCC 5710]|eukprot:CCG81562.1 Translation initiation factor eIF-2B subunit gamma [Taphrina deformans PYCC 5710]